MNVTSFITYFSHSFLVLQNLTGTSAVRILLCQLTAHSNSSVITTHTHFCLWNSRPRYTCLNKPVTFSGFFPTIPLLLRKAFHTLHWKQEYFNYFQSPLHSYHCPDAPNSSATPLPRPLLPPAPYLCPLRLSAQPAQAPAVPIHNGPTYN